MTLNISIIHKDCFHVFVVLQQRPFAFYKIHTDILFVHVQGRVYVQGEFHAKLESFLLGAGSGLGPGAVHKQLCKGLLVRSAGLLARAAGSVGAEGWV